MGETEFYLLREKGDTRMLGKERGTVSGSDLYFQTPSEMARRMLYYMTSCGYYYTDYDYRIEREDYHNYMVFYVCNGRLSLTSGGRTMVASAGQAGMLNCHKPQEYHAIGNAEFIWLHLDGINTGQFYEQIVQQKKGFVFDTVNAGEIKDRIYELVFACRNDQLPGEVRLSHKLGGVLTALLDDSAPPDAPDNPDSPIGTAIHFIREHYSEPITLEDVAQSVHMSQYHFSRLFKRECGYSPHEYIILVRLNRAKHLLKTTDLSVKSIAQSVGYQNVTTFSNAFSNRVGLAPSVFRRYPV